MKASEFKEIIKEAVREAIREELSVARVDTPPPPPVKAPEPMKFKSSSPLMEALNMTSQAMASGQYTDEESHSPSTVRANMSEMFAGNSYSAKPTYKPVSEDPRAVASAIAAAPKVGLDLSQLGFINKAAAIVKLADKKSQPYGF